MAQKLDIILFGATGFTGTHAIPLLVKFSKNDQFTWGIAGRSEEKLRALLNDCKKQTDLELPEGIPVIIADIEKESTLREMTRRARIIIDCCGPYRFFGEPVVKACVEEGTHYVDVSGEIQFIEEMQLKYHKKAQEKGVYIISACGWESIPVDLGIVFLQQNFSGTLNSVAAYISMKEVGTGPIHGSMVNSGSWESAIHVLADVKKLKDILWKTGSIFEPKLKLKVLPHKNPDMSDGWAVPFPATDTPVVRRSQHHFYEQDLKRPIQIESYIIIDSLFYTFLSAIGFIIILFLSQFSFGRSLLLKNPEVFTLGYISSGQPNKERTKRTRFCTTLYGEGWKEKLSDANDQYTIPPDRAITAKVSGQDPAYGATCLCLVLAAITIITETDKMPPRGGVLPPGYAFANTSLRQQLNKNGVKFEIIQEKDL